MKKSTKTLWIYTAILFSIAILLILVTTFTQSKIVDDNGNLSVLGTLTATSKQKIINLQNENIKLGEELNVLKQEHAELLESSAALIKQSEEEQVIKEKVAKLYKAYAEDDYGTMQSLMEELTEAQINERIPSLYRRVQRVLEE